MKNSRCFSGCFFILITTLRAMKLNKKLDRIAASFCPLLTFIGFVDPSTEDKGQEIKFLEESLAIEREKPLQLRKFRPIAQS